MKVLIIVVVLWLIALSVGVGYLAWWTGLIF